MRCMVDRGLQPCSVSFTSPRDSVERQRSRPFVAPHEVIEQIWQAVRVDDKVMLGKVWCREDPFNVAVSGAVVAGRGSKAAQARVLCVRGEELARLTTLAHSRARWVPEQGSNRLMRLDHTCESPELVQCGREHA